MGFDPISLTLAATAIGGAVKGGSEIFGGFTKSAMYSYQSAYAQEKAARDFQMAEYQRSVGELKAARSGLQTRQDVGKLSEFRGFRLDQPGTMPGLVQSVLQRGQEDERVIRGGAALAATEREMAGTEQLVQSDIYRKSAQTSKIAGLVGGAGTFVSSAGAVADKWLQYKDLTGGSSDDIEEV